MIKDEISSSFFISEAGSHLSPMGAFHHHDLQSHPCETVTNSQPYPKTFPAPAPPDGPLPKTAQFMADLPRLFLYIRPAQPT